VLLTAATADRGSSTSAHSCALPLGVRPAHASQTRSLTGRVRTFWEPRTVECTSFSCMVPGASASHTALHAKEWQAGQLPPAAAATTSTRVTARTAPAPANAYAPVGLGRRPRSSLTMSPLHHSCRLGDWVANGHRNYVCNRLPGRPSRPARWLGNCQTFSPQSQGRAGWPGAASAPNAKRCLGNPTTLDPPCRNVVGTGAPTPCAFRGFICAEALRALLAFLARRLAGRPSHCPGSPTCPAPPRGS
jgi:hypothetical protein